MIVEIAMKVKIGFFDITASQTSQDAAHRQLSAHWLQVIKP